MSIPVESGKCEFLVIRGVDGLDPITVVFRDAGAERGELIITVWGKAWSAYWGAMGTNTVREFVETCGVDYITSKLIDHSRKNLKRDTDYLERIVRAIKISLEAMRAAA